MSSFYRKTGKNGTVYLYESIARYDPIKKRNNPIRVYIGIEDPVTKKVTNPRKDAWKAQITKIEGVSCAIEQIDEKISLSKNLENSGFEKSDVDTMIAISAYILAADGPIDNFKYFANSHNKFDNFALSSPRISEFVSRIGKNQLARSKFIKAHAKEHAIGGNVYLDVTSISSYSNNLSHVEMGYNRDKENLPQINLSMLISRESNMVIGYKKYQGSISDVATIKDFITTAKNELELNVDLTKLVMDRGFNSQKNLQDLNAENYNYIIPMSNTLVLSKRLISENFIELATKTQAFTTESAFVTSIYKKENIGKRDCHCHIFMNAQSKATRSHNHGRILQTISEKTLDLSFESEENAFKYIANIHSRTYAKLYDTIKLRDGFQIVLNEERSHNYCMSFGVIILIATDLNLSSREVYLQYIERDKVEKFFDSLKNEQHLSRTRVHSDEALEGRIFIHMLALNMWGYINKCMNKLNDKDKLSTRNIFDELSEITKTSYEKGKSELNLISKKQREIFKKLELNLPT